MTKESKKTATPPTGASELAELTAAMNNLATALHETNRIANAFQADERWASLPAILMDLNKRLTAIATRIR